MLNKIKKNSLDYLPLKVTIEQSQNNLYNILPPKIVKLNKKISTQRMIPKINLNKIIKSKKRVNSMSTIINNKLNNFLEEKNSFIFCPKNQKLINYFNQKNKNVLYNLSIKNKNKNSTLKNLNTINDIKLNYINNKKTGTNISKTIPKIKKTLNKSSSVSIIENYKNKFNKTNNLNSINNNTNNINKKFYNKSNYSKYLINIKKFIEERKNDNYLHNLINNSYNEYFNSIENCNKVKHKYKKQYSSFKYYNINLSQNNIYKKKVDPKTLELISNETNTIKSMLEQKNAKKEEIFKSRQLRKRVRLEKIRNDKNNFENFIYQPKNENNIIVQRQFDLLKRKINNNTFTNCKEIELGNSFTTKLRLYISNPIDQVINTRLYGKLIEDNKFLKDLHHNYILQLK